MSNETKIQQQDTGLLQRMHVHAEGLKKSYFAAWEAVWPTAEKREVLGFYAAVRQLMLHPVNGPKLARCPNLGEALMGAAAMGLNPAFGPLGQAIVMAAGDKAELIIGFKGYEAAWIRDGVVKPGGIFTKIVMPQDDFNDELTTEGQVFRYKQGPEDRDVSKMICSIAALYLRDGGVKVLRRDRAKFEKVRKWATGRAAGKQSPYDAWPEEMALKGAILEGKRDMPIGSCMMRILEWEAEHDPEPHEKDMGDVVRVENVRPLQVQALPDPAPRETIEVTTREAEPVTVETPVEKPAAKMLIQDESTAPDKPAKPPPAFPEWALVKLKEWESTNEKMPKATYDELVREVQRLDKNSEERKDIGKRLLKLGHAPDAATEREPGSEG